MATLVFALRVLEDQNRLQHGCRVKVILSQCGDLVFGCGSMTPCVCFKHVLCVCHGLTWIDLWAVEKSVWVCQDRFSVPSAGGWRDCMINFVLPKSGHIVEVRIQIDAHIHSECMAVDVSYSCPRWIFGVDITRARLTQHHPIFSYVLRFMTEMR